MDDEAKKSFTVIHGYASAGNYENFSAEAEKWCSEHQWRHLERDNIFGSEDQGVILLDTILIPEAISRGRNLLVIVTTRGKKE